jgi:hypothetical protein
MEGVKGMSEVEQPPPELTFGRIVRRIPLYIGLALVGLAVMTLLVAVCIRFGLTRYITGVWIGLIGYTGLLFWVVVRNARPHWYRWNFWLITLALLATHCSIFVAILHVYPEWRMIWFWPITVFEAGVLGAILEWLFPETHMRHRRVAEL